MATRLTGEMRLRLSRDSARAHIPYARKLLGELKEQLAYNNLKAGQLIRTLDDGTTVRALYDGSLFIAEIVSAEDKGKCEAFIPDIIGLAMVPSDADEFPLTDSPTPAYLPCTQQTLILGRVVARPAPDAPVAALTEASARARWASGGFRPPGAGSIPAGTYSRVVDACGETHKVHENLVCGDWDWTNGRDTLTCWTGSAYNLTVDGNYGGTAYVSSQRYGAQGVGTGVYLRGRLLYSVPEQHVVNGMCLRKVAGVTYLMVVWREREGLSGGLQRVRIRWTAGEPYPRVDEAETVCEFLQDTVSMWCFNASGTEARRIASDMESATCEQILTDDGIEYLDPEELVIEDTYSVTGSSSSRRVWLPFTWEFYGIATPEFDPDNAPFPLRTGISNVDTNALRLAYFNYGDTMDAASTGVRIVKIAVDYIGDEVEYLFTRVSGTNGRTILNNNPSSSYELVEYVRDRPVPDHPGCPLDDPIPFTTSWTLRTHQKLHAAASKVHSYTTATHEYFSTSHEIASESVGQYLLNTSATTVVETYYFYEDARDGLHTCSYLDYPHSDSHPVTWTEDRRYRLERDSATVITATAQQCSLMYFDLRYGIFVVRKVVGVSSGSETNATVIGIDSGGADGAEENVYREYTDTSTTTNTTENSGTEDITVYYRGEVVYENHVDAAPSGGTSTSSGPIAELNPEDHITTNQRRANPLIWRYFAATHLEATLGSTAVPPDAYDYGGYEGHPDVEAWYERSPYAVRADGGYTPFDGAQVNTPTTGLGYPVYESGPREFRRTVVYQPDVAYADPEDYTYNVPKPLHSVAFGVAADSENLFFSMPLPTGGSGEDWTVVNIMPEWVYTSTGAPDTYSFFPMSFISPAFNS